MRKISVSSPPQTDDASRQRTTDGVSKRILEVSEEGETVRLRTEGGGEQHGGGQRSEVTEFSDRAARRLRLRLGELRTDADGVAVTLTARGTECPTGAEMKRQLSRLLDWLRGEFPEAAAVWRMEASRRRTGLWRGKAVPHVHATVYGVPLAALKVRLPFAWQSLGGGRVQVEKVKDPSRWRSYLCKREDPDASRALGACGRRWGTVRRDRLPWGTVKRVRLTEAAFYRLRRWMRRLAGCRVGAVVSVDPERWLEAARLARAGPP